MTTTNTLAGGSALGGDRSFAMRLLVAVLGLLVISAALRLFHLGRWPFAGDELATLIELKSLFGMISLSPDSVFARLPQVIPLGYAFIGTGVALFGETEFGSRLAPALLGAATPVAIFLILRRDRSLLFPLIVGALVALWPDHLFFSQNARYYSLAMLLAFVAVALGARSIEPGEIRAFGWACAVVVVGLFAHTLVVLVLPLICIGVWLGHKVERRPVPLFFYAASAVAGAILLVLGWFFLRPRLQGWNAQQEWGYGSLHAVLSAVNSLGWPWALLAATGTLLLLARWRDGRSVYWLVGLAGLAAALLVLPRVVVFHPGYGTFFMLPAFVAVAVATVAIADTLGRLSRPAGALWPIMVAALALPSVASHFVDGTRPDFRAAAAYVRENWRPGDRWAGNPPEYLDHYGGGLAPALTLPLGAQFLPTIQQLATGPGRVWFVIPSSRRGYGPELQAWLMQNLHLRQRVSPTRFDYHQLAVDVFLYTPAP